MNSKKIYKQKKFWKFRRWYMITFQNIRGSLLVFLDFPKLGRRNQMIGIFKHVFVCPFNAIPLNHEIGKKWIEYSYHGD